MAENQEQTKGLYVRNTTIIAALAGVVVGAVLCGAVILSGYREGFKLTQAGGEDGP